MTTIHTPQSTLALSTLKELQREAPVVGDKALIDLVNGLQVNRDLLRFRQRQGGLSRLIDRMNGNERRRRLVLDLNLSEAQEALCGWVAELCDSLRVSQTALTYTQQSLLEAREAIRRQALDLQVHATALHALSHRLDQLAADLHTRLEALEARVQRLEAHETINRAVSAWASGRTYGGFHRIIQIVLLAREVISDSNLFWHTQSDCSGELLNLLADKIVAECPDLSETSFSLKYLLDQTWGSMNGDKLEMAAWLLDMRSAPFQRLPHLSHLFVLGATLEFAILPEEARPSQPGLCAIELYRAQIGQIPYLTDRRRFIRAVIEETAYDCRRMAEKKYE